MKEVKIYADGLDPSALEQFESAMEQEFSIKGALMPDTHKGYSLPIGAVVATKDVIVPAWVGYDIGCFTIDTKVQLTDGRQLSFIELIKENEKGKINYTFSKTKDSNIVISQILNPRKTKTVNRLCELTLDNNEVINCTTDHIFYRRTGEEVRACDLKTGDSLFPYYEKLDNDISEDQLESEYYHGNGYKVVFNPNSLKYAYVHYLSDDFNVVNDVYKEIPKSIRHHIDFNKSNNNPDNILRCEWKEHFKLHNSDKTHNSEKGRHWGSEAHRRYPEMYSKMGAENMTKLHNNKDFADRRDKRARDTFIKINKNPTKSMKKNWSEAGKRGAKFLDNTNEKINIKRNVSKVKQIVDRTIEIYGELTKENYTKVRDSGEFYNGKHWDNAIMWCKKAKINIEDLVKNNFTIPNNHKVISVKIINCEPTDVYCMTIDKYHNFALASGVFVHNCGMCAFKTNFKKEDVNKHKNKIFDEIYETIPVGFNKNISEIDYPISGLTFKGSEIATSKKYKSALGSLGGGNHFIEIGYDEEDSVWIIIHSGSRGVGHGIASYYMKLASTNKEELEEIFDEDNKALLKFNKTQYDSYKEKYISKHLSNAKPKEGHYHFNVNSEKGKDYITDMNWCLIYALDNRKEMMIRVLRAISKHTKRSFDINFSKMINRNHNHAVEKDGLWIHRKGATHAENGMLGVIPGNMRDGSFIVEGIGNEDSLCSSSHGAGRVLGRKEAKEKLSISDFINETKNIKGKIDESTLDEAPMAYKDIFKVMQLQHELVKVIAHVKPIINIKG